MGSAKASLSDYLQEQLEWALDGVPRRRGSRRDSWDALMDSLWSCLDSAWAAADFLGAWPDSSEAVMDSWCPGRDPLGSAVDSVRAVLVKDSALSKLEVLKAVMDFLDAWLDSPRTAPDRW